MATLSLTTHFTVDIDDDDSHTITGGSTTATDSITITHYFERGTLLRILHLLKYGMIRC